VASLAFARLTRSTPDEEHAVPRYYFYLREEAAPPHITGHITGAVFQDAAAAKRFAKKLRTALTAAPHAPKRIGQLR
jgi:hypothetical protein